MMQFMVLQVIGLIIIIIFPKIALWLTCLPIWTVDFFSLLYKIVIQEKSQYSVLLNWELVSVNPK